MLTIKKLKEIIESKNIPDDAEIMIEADHGQNIEDACFCTISRSISTDIPESMIFECDNMDDYYDDYALEEYDRDGKITALLISSY